MIANYKNVIIGDGVPARVLATHALSDDLAIVCCGLSTKINISQNIWLSGVGGSAANWGGNLFFCYTEFDGQAKRFHSIVKTILSGSNISFTEYDTDHGRGLLVPKGANLTRIGTLVLGDVEKIRPIRKGFLIYLNNQVIKAQNIAIATGAQSRFEIVGECLVTVFNNQEITDKLFEIEHSNINYGEISTFYDEITDEAIARFQLKNPALQNGSEKQILKLIHLLNSALPISKLNIYNLCVGLLIKLNFKYTKNAARYTYLKTTSLPHSHISNNRISQEYWHRACHPELWQPDSVYRWFKTYGVQNDQLFEFERKGRGRPQRFGAVGTRIGRLLG